ncbi:MAG: M20/M25/M40 family metallo-hydrolase, partial [Hyphomicrobiales bacterium]
LELLTNLTETLDTGTEHFEPSNLEITSVDVGNLALNIIPARARALFNVRFNDTYTPASLEAWLRQRLADGDTSQVQATLKTSSNAQSFLTPTGPFTDLVGAAVEAATGTRPALSTGGGTSDARFISRACPVVEFGLVGRSMHQIDEQVPLPELAGLAQAYRHILNRYFTEV